MGKRYFVSTDIEGVERLGEREIRWNLPSAKGEEAVTEAGENGPALLLRSARALLDVLDEEIFLASASECENAEQDVVEVRRAQLRATAWNPLLAAKFALICVEHVTDGMQDVELTGHLTIGEVIKDARRVLEDASSQATGPASRLGRLLSIRRLRHESDAIEQLSTAAGGEDLEHDLDSLDDPAWTSLSAVDHAVFAVVEAVRHVVLPRYTALRESTASEASAEQPVMSPSVQMTPWGPILIGASYEPTHIPAAIACREAALRSRQVAAARIAAEAEQSEYEFQADELESLLLSKG